MATTKPKLSATQRRLVEELNQIADLFNLSPTSILEEDPDSWTPRLRLAKDQLVRSQVVVWYTLVDEFLNSRIAHYLFSRRRSFPELWRTKRFKLFNYHVLEELSLLQKVRFVKAIEGGQNLSLPISSDSTPSGMAWRTPFSPKTSRRSSPSGKARAS